MHFVLTYWLLKINWKAGNVPRGLSYWGLSYFDTLEEVADKWTDNSHQINVTDI